MGQTAASIGPGIAHSTDDAAILGLRLKQAEEALYCAMQASQDRVTVFIPSSASSTRSRVD